MFRDLRKAYILYCALYNIIYIWKDFFLISSFVSNFSPAKRVYKAIIFPVIRQCPYIFQWKSSDFNGNEKAAVYLFSLRYSYPDLHLIDIFVSNTAEKLVGTYTIYYITLMYIDKCPIRRMLTY